MTATQATEQLVETALQLSSSGNGDSVFNGYDAATILEMALVMLRGKRRSTRNISMAPRVLSSNATASNAHVITNAVCRAIKEGHEINSTITALTHNNDY